jgi:2,3-bisphosphoglycerate-dependent phosphoglycerate mutase
MKVTTLFFALVLSLSGAHSTDLQAEKTVFLIRHAETCTEQGSDPHLSSIGQARAVELSRTLMDVELEQIFSTPFNRTLETAGPISESQSLETVQVPLGNGFLDRWAELIRESDARVILVSGHSNTTPAMINKLIGTSLTDLNERDYDRLFVVHLREDGTGTYSILRYGAPSGAPQSC